MNEKLLGIYLDRADEMLDGANTVTEKALVLQIKIQARQARQLTCIADQVSGYLVATHTEATPERELARHQPCGCIVCFCFGDRCRDCGAKNCCKDDCVFKTSKGIVYADEPTLNPEQTLNNLTKLLNEDGEEEYLERAMAIVNDWRKKQQPTPDVPTDALVEAAENIKAALVSNAAPTDVIHALKETLKEKGGESVTISPSLLIPLLDALAAHEKAGG